MLYRFVFTLIMGWASNCLAWQNELPANFNYESYYQAFSSEDTMLFNRELNALASYSGVEKDAFYGAILMKKSKSFPSIKQKLDAFRDGRDLLEASIKAEPQNAEYRFLRLATQENAPGFLNYNNNKQEDAKMIADYFSSLPNISKKFIRDYARVSDTLKFEDLK